MSEPTEQAPDAALPADADVAFSSDSAARPRASWVREAIAGVAIVGLLAAIAVPITIDQRKKAVDARVKQDLTAVEESVTEWVNTYEQLPAMRIDGSAVYLDDIHMVTLHEGTILSELQGASTSTWCVTAMNPSGKHAANPGYRYKASAEKIDTGEC